MVYLLIVLYLACWVFTGWFSIKNQASAIAMSIILFAIMFSASIHFTLF